MISFDLQCRHGHVFEIWFRSSADYEEQRQRALIACPVCHDPDVNKAVMAPNIAAKGNSAAGAVPALRQATAPVASDTALTMSAGSGVELPPQAMAVLAAIAEHQAKLLPQSRWVGRRFADEARAIHRANEAGDSAGDDTAMPAIHGQATPAEAQALVDEGIAVMPLLVPIVPPDQQN